MFHMLPNRLFYAAVDSALRGQSIVVILLIKSAYMIVLTGLVYVGARLSWIVIERRFLKLKDRFFVRQPAYSDQGAPSVDIRARLKTHAVGD
jgi:hypothetical protein